MGVAATGGLSPWGAARAVARASRASPRDIAVLAVPAALYAMQNNLLYLAMGHLDATTVQVLYQMKVATTACFSVGMLGARLSPQRWAALAVLLLGAALVASADTVGTGGGGDARDVGANPVLGCAAVLLASMTSGFAACVFEARLGSVHGRGGGLWTRNAQLAALGVAFSGAGVLVADLDAVRSRGLLAGYTPLVWVLVLDFSAGGLLVSVVVQYAGSIAKVFATTVAIVLSGALSCSVLGDLDPSPQFVGGAALVLAASVAYALDAGGGAAVRAR